VHVLLSVAIAVPDEVPLLQATCIHSVLGTWAGRLLIQHRLPTKGHTRIQAQIQLLSDSHHLNTIKMSFARASIGLIALAASVSASIKTCSNNNTFSCQSSSKAGTCCYNYPGGALLQTQFWDTDPVTGPTDSWTIHGLW
jgi:hypothetical protein